MARLTMYTAPQDGTEIIVWDERGNASLAAWFDHKKIIQDGTDSKLDMFRSTGQLNESGWVSRAEGEWDLFDGFGLQWLEPVLWSYLP
jgi:hypothetical protein